MSNSFFVNADFEQPFRGIGLTSIESIFSFEGGRNLLKKNLAGFRNRLQFTIDSPATTLFLKRYDRPPVWIQLKSWLSHHKRISCGLTESVSAGQLSAAGINTPKIVSCGEQWGIFFEKRSFTITEKIPNAESLERKLPDFFAGPGVEGVPPCRGRPALESQAGSLRHLEARDTLKLRKDFIARLAVFVRRFHQTGYRHRDLYFSHIFYSNSGEFCLIDLARAFKPMLLYERFRVKDIAQLHYSAPSERFSRTDRLRFYLVYAECNTLNKKSKLFIRKVVKKTIKMSRHGAKHGYGNNWKKVN